MRVDYDHETGAAYVTLSDEPVAETIEFDHAHVLDLDAAGRVRGIELLAPHRGRRLPEIALEHGLADVYREVAKALDDALAGADRPEGSTVQRTLVTRGTVGVFLSRGVPTGEAVGEGRTVANGQVVVFS